MDTTENTPVEPPPFNLKQSNVPDRPPARPAELLGRFFLGGALLALLFIFWSGHLQAAAESSEKAFRILPRLSIFLAGAALAGLLQGARPNAWLLCLFGVCAGAFMLWTLPLATEINAADSRDARTFLGVQSLQLLRLEAAMFSAVMLGTCLGRDIKLPFHFITIVLCAAVGDMWLSAFHVPESVDAQDGLRLLRMPWPPQIGELGLTPAFTDILFLSALMQGARCLRYPVVSLLMGAAAGYCAASFLALEPWPAWPALSVLMFGGGILVGCWPELKCNFRDTGKAFLISAMLLATLVGLSGMHRRLHPVNEGLRDPVGYYRGAT